MDEKLAKYIAQQLRKPNGEKAVEIGEKMNEGNQLINLNTINSFQVKNNDQILEIGMRNGFFVRDILSKNKSINYFGCDYSEIMVEDASLRNIRFIKMGRAEFYLADSKKLPFEKHMFDTIFTINTIYFWENPKAALFEISRVLKPGGKIIIAIRPKSEMIHYPMTKYGFKMYTRNDLIKLLIQKNWLKEKVN